MKDVKNRKKVENRGIEIKIAKKNKNKGTPEGVFSPYLWSRGRA